MQESIPSTPSEVADSNIAHALVAVYETAVSLSVGTLLSLVGLVMFGLSDSRNITLFIVGPCIMAHVVLFHGLGVNDLVRHTLLEAGRGPGTWTFGWRRLCCPSARAGWVPPVLVAAYVHVTSNSSR